MNQPDRPTTFSSVSVEQAVRQGFKYFNRYMTLMWRLGLGALHGCYPPITGRFLVLTHTGRKTGIRRRTPLNYAIINGDVYCTAGFGPQSDWYRNVRTHPSVEVWLPDGWWAGVADDVSDCADRLVLLRQVLQGSGLVAPLVGVAPQRLSDVELATRTAHYRLVRIRRTVARTGPGGPGDLMWVWPLATLFLLVWGMRRRRRQNSG
jgi:deazaflavin-dependent oxidoreductase (nitroreductase family)